MVLTGLASAFVFCAGGATPANLRADATILRSGAPGSQSQIQVTVTGGGPGTTVTVQTPLVGHDLVLPVSLSAAPSGSEVVGQLAPPAGGLSITRVSVSPAYVNPDVTAVVAVTVEAVVERRALGASTYDHNNENESGEEETERRGARQEPGHRGGGQERRERNAAHDEGDERSASHQAVVTATINDGEGLLLGKSTQQFELDAQLEGEGRHGRHAQPTALVSSILTFATTTNGQRWLPGRYTVRVKLEVVRTVEPRCGRRNRSHCPGLRRRTLAQSGDATATLRIVGVGAPAEPARTGTLTFSAAAQRVYPLTIHAVDGQGRYATTTTLFFIQSAQGAELVDLVGLRQRAFRARYESALAHTGGETAGLGGLDLIPSVTVVEGDPVGQNSIHVKTRVAGTRPFVSGSPVPQSEPLAALTVCLVQVTRLPLLPQFWRTLGCSETDLNGWADIEVNDPYSPDLTLIVRTENHNIELSASQTMVFTAGGFQFDPLVLSDLLAMCPGLWCVRADVPPLRSNGIASALINITLEPGSLSNEFVINSEDDTGFGFNVFNEVVKARRAFDSLGVPPRSSLGAVGDLLKVRYPGGYGGQDASQYGGCTPGADVPCYRVGSGVMWLPPVVFHSGPPRATGENALDDASLRAVHHEFGHYVMDMTYGHRVGSGAPEVCEVAEPGTSVGDCDPQLPGVVFVSHSPDGLCGNATALRGWIITT